MDKEAARIEHLKLIQQVIERLARSSFVIKTAASTVTAAIVAATVAASTPAIGLGGVALLSLWGLDAFYLSRERRFRALFNQVRTGAASEFSTKSYFTMTTHPGPSGSAWRAACSSTLVTLYPSLLLVIGAVAAATQLD